MLKVTRKVCGCQPYFYPCECNTQPFFVHAVVILQGIEFYVILIKNCSLDNGKFELCDVDQIECLEDLENALRQVSAASSFNQVPHNVAQVMKENNINCSCPSGIFLYVK